MKIQFFKVRIDTEFCETDQKMLNRFMNQVDVINVDRQFVPDEKCWSIVLSYEPLQKDGKAVVPEMDTESSLSESERERYETLKIWRNEKAKTMNIPAYFIASNRELVRVAKAQIEEPEDLAKVKGFKEKKLETYGEEIVALLNSIAMPVI